jgi:hypothetical protein
MPENVNVGEISNALFPAWNFVHEAREIRTEMLGTSN